jgi:hypothetical protein
MHQHCHRGSNRWWVVREEAGGGQVDGRADCRPGSGGGQVDGRAPEKVEGKGTAAVEKEEKEVRPQYRRRVASAGNSTRRCAPRRRHARLGPQIRPALFPLPVSEKLPLRPLPPPPIPLGLC